MRLHSCITNHICDYKLFVFSLIKHNIWNPQLFQKQSLSKYSLQSCHSPLNAGVWYLGKMEIVLNVHWSISFPLTSETPYMALQRFKREQTWLPKCYCICWNQVHPGKMINHEGWISTTYKIKAPAAVSSLCWSLEVKTFEHWQQQSKNNSKLEFQKAAVFISRLHRFCIYKCRLFDKMIHFKVSIENPRHHLLSLSISLLLFLFFWALQITYYPNLEYFTPPMTLETQGATTVCTDGNHIYLWHFLWNWRMSNVCLRL